MSSSNSVPTEAGESAYGVQLLEFRFYPTQEVLVSYYLKKKIQGQDSTFKYIIPEIDVCKLEPWDIPAFFGEPDVPDPEKEWIFFSRPAYKYNNSPRRIRTTDQGFYKMQGKVRDIKAEQSSAVVGQKRTLTFYRGRPPNGEKDNWVIHEYFLTKSEKGRKSDKQDFVLCRLKKQPANSKNSDSGSGAAGGGHVASNSDDEGAAATDMILYPVEHLAPTEQGDVFNGNGNHDECYQSPNGSFLGNAISTCDDDETGGLHLAGFVSNLHLDESFKSIQL